MTRSSRGRDIRDGGCGHGLLLRLWGVHFGGVLDVGRAVSVTGGEVGGPGAGGEKSSQRLLGAIPGQWGEKRLYAESPC